MRNIIQAFRNRASTVLGLLALSTLAACSETSYTSSGEINGLEKLAASGNDDAAETQAACLQEFAATTGDEMIILIVTDAERHKATRQFRRPVYVKWRMPMTSQ